MKRIRLLTSLYLGVAWLVLAACDIGAQSAETPQPTATLAPIVSQTPRFTATPIPSRTPLPTATFTPSDTVIPPTPTETFTPSPTPPILGSINSLQSINVRSGPGVNFEAITVLRPATRVEVLGRNNDGVWLNIRLEDGTEGWVSATLVRIQPTATPFPSLTPSPDLTLMAQGTPLPTALFGGGTVTPTPPRSISAASPSPVTTVDGPLETPLNAATAVAGLQLPNIEAINQTATALAQGGIAAPGPTLPGLGGPTGGPLEVTGTATAVPLPAGTVSTQQGVDVLAYCNDLSFGRPAPTDLAAGSTIEIFWAWFANTRQQVQDHMNAAVYDVRLDGEPLAWRQYAQPITEQSGQFVVYWYVPAGPLTRGEHEITYTVTWRSQISDGLKDFGPGTGTPLETGSCTFTVR
ncbi:MAG: SH3 domain-containing protein [Chloroflexi bacterium]|nr:SH3 domain-containing protein [Chloroflexota bacterium]